MRDTDFRPSRGRSGRGAGECLGGASRWRRGAWTLAVLLAAGCGDSTSPQSSPDKPPRSPVAAGESPSAATAEPSGLGQAAGTPPGGGGTERPPRRRPALPQQPLKPLAPPGKPPRRDLTELLAPETLANAPRRTIPLPPIDEQQVAAQGIRRLVGKHLTLYTDLPPDPAVDELPLVFDAAVPLWARYFQVPPEECADWKLRGSLIQDEARFRAAGLVHDLTPPLVHGYQLGQELWLREQPTAYYRRHLLLHEGVHGWMNRFLGGAGNPWYMEGMAELLATHLWNTERRELAINYFPESKEQLSHWGRIKLVRDSFRDGQALPLSQIMRLPPEAHREVDAYGWCWAAAVFFDRHPQWSRPFAALAKRADDTTPRFSEQFYEQLKPNWPLVQLQWQWFVASVDYGYDVRREVIEFGERPQPLPEAGQIVTLRTDRGWQDVGIRVEADQLYRIRAKGRFQLAEREGKVWWSEPGGVTIHYLHGMPLGVLLAAAQQTEEPLAGKAGLLEPVPIGTDRQVRFSQGGRLFLRINDQSLAENQGEILVKVELLRE